VSHTIEILVRHGYIVLLVVVFAEQIGLPVPSPPMLLAAGALAGTGRMSLPLALSLAIFAALLGDLIWYVLGRKRGIRVLQFLCRISLEPDSCVRNTEEIFARHGARSLLVAKFIPGLSTAAPPLAGVFHMKIGKFLSFDTLGSLLWVGVYTGLGYAFSDKLELLAEHGARFGTGLGFLMIAGLAGFVAWKFIKRRRFLRDLRLARITPAELREKMKAGEELVIVDLRHSLSFEADPEYIPGALHIDPEEFDHKQGDIPRDRDVILYCT
jgi:membrane protein DedA with SNARE-associated domain